MNENALTAADAMQVAVRTIPSATTLPELEKRFLEDGVSGFPVVDEGKLVGVVSRSDIVRQLCNERDVAENTSDFYYDESGFYETKMESLKDVADRVGERLEAMTVADVMARNPHTVSLNQPIGDVARRFVDRRVHRFPVTDHGELVGIVTTMDLVRLIATNRLRP